MMVKTGIWKDCSGSDFLALSSSEGTLSDMLLKRVHAWNSDLITLACVKREIRDGTHWDADSVFRKLTDANQNVCYLSGDVTMHPSEAQLDIEKFFSVFDLIE